MEDKDIKKKQQAEEHSDATVKPDPETLGKTDPQDEMKGPVSSLMQKGSKIMEGNTSKEEADKKHEENL